MDDDLWALIEPLLPPSPEKAPGPRPVPDRLCLQGLLYVLHNDIPWQLLPLELGFGGDKGYDSDPNRRGLRKRRILPVSRRGAPNIEGLSKLRYVVEQTFGRKRSIVTDTIGLLLTVRGTAAGAQESVAGTALLDQVAANHPGIRKVWVDCGYHRHPADYAATLGIDMEITVRKPGSRGFTPISKRWAVECTYGWLMLHRRLARDYETLPTCSEAVIHIAMTDLMTRRPPATTPSPGVTRKRTQNMPSRDETSDENDL